MVQRGIDGLAWASSKIAASSSFIHSSSSPPLFSLHFVLFLPPSSDVFHQPHHFHRPSTMSVVDGDPRFCFAHKWLQPFSLSPPFLSPIYKSLRVAVVSKWEGMKRVFFHIICCAKSCPVPHCPPFPPNSKAGRWLRIARGVQPFYGLLFSSDKLILHNRIWKNWHAFCWFTFLKCSSWTTLLFFCILYDFLLPFYEPFS